jgi:predicted deacetylase
MEKEIKITLIVLLTIFLIFFTIRIFSPKEIDDISPLIYCEQEYYAKADILWVIPKFNEVKISENKTWCKKILDSNKIIGMHGIKHLYHEFEHTINETELIDAKKDFEECFNFTPTLFKAPNLALSYENKLLLEKNNFTIKGVMNQNFHKVYHCNNTGIFPNRFHDFF